MKKKHYLQKREEELVDSNCKDSRLYRNIRSLALRAEVLSDSFALSAADLYYHVLCSIDSLIMRMTDEEEDELEYCEDLWQELRSHFADNVECDEADHRLAATLIVCTLYNLLFIGDRAQYGSCYRLLRKTTKDSANEQRERIEGIIDEVLYKDGVSQELQEWMIGYASDDLCLSDKIANMILEFREASILSGMKEDADELVEELKEYFWNDKERTEKFVVDIHGQDDFTVIDEIAKRINAKPPKMLKKNKAKLWRILNKYKLYQATQANFSNLLKNKGY